MTSKTERIELRAAPADKRLLVAAAACEGVDVTTFVLGAVLPIAREVVDRATHVRLSPRDTERVLALLEDPPDPTPALLAAARRRHG